MRCEGAVRHGGVFTLGKPKWEQCKKEAMVLITFEQSPGGFGHDITKGALPSCSDCWNEAINAEGVKIIKVTPIEVVTFNPRTPEKNIIEIVSMILDRLNEHGNIDSVREEGPIQDLRNANEEMIKKHIGT